MNTRAHVAIRLAIWLGAASAVACPGLLAAAPVATEPVRIEVPSESNLQFLTLWVAIGSGAFEKHGLKPRILVSPSPRQTGQMLLRGDADVAVLPPPMFLGMMAERKPILLFASLLSNEPINLVLRKDTAERLRFRADAPLRERLALLAGLKIGLAPEVAPRLRALFASAGLQADRQLRFVTIAGPDQVQAFTDGKVDLLFAHTPYLETTLVRYGAVLVVNDSNGEIPGLADGQIHALAATGDTVRNRPELIEKISAAIGDALHLLHSDQPGALEALIASGADRLDPRVAAATVKVYAPAVPDTPQVSIPGIIRDRDLYPAHPKAPDFKVVRIQDFVVAASNR